MVQWAWNYGLESNLSDMQPCGLGLHLIFFLGKVEIIILNLPTKSI